MSVWLLYGIGGILAIVGLTAILAPPNTWDVMVYHMPRVAQWANNRTVAFFPTFDYGQLIFSPWAEYAMAHLYILGGGDRFVNLVEWFSLAGSIVGVSLIARSLGAGARGQVLAAVLCATIPEGILEASGSMNTYVLTFWLVASVYFLLRWNEEPDWFHALGAGTAIGLAVFTKGTAFLIVPCMVAACWWMGAPRARRLFLMRLPVLALLVLAINLPQAVRNYDLTGSPLGLPFPAGGDRLRWSNGRITLAGTVSGVLRNAALHLGTPSTRVNLWTEHAISRAIRFIGEDPDDPANTWQGSVYSNRFHVNGLARHEIYAGNPLHLGLALLACLLLLLNRRRKDFVSLAPYIFGLLLSFLLFCAMLRWQIWNSRHHLPLFVLGAAVTGVILERYWPPRATMAVAVVLLLAAAPFALGNKLRSLLPWDSAFLLRAPRSGLYFADEHQRLTHSWIAAVSALRSADCANIGLDSPSEYFVYPMFALLEASPGDRIVRYAGVRNLTSRFAPAGTPRPCAVVCIGCAKTREKWDEYSHDGTQASVFGDVVVFGAPVQNVPPGEKITSASSRLRDAAISQVKTERK